MAKNISEEHILCAAVKFCGAVIPGYRHSNCYNTIKLIAPNHKFNGADRENQGFLTSNERFVNRADAFQIARKQNQIQKTSPMATAKSGELTSEDIY